jgi:hypothetical protein
MTISSPDSSTAQPKMVLCPRCGLPCSLMPLRRPGAYRLVDPDGHGHAAVCIAAAQPAQPPVRYRPVVAPTPVRAPAYRPMAGVARRA